MRVKCLINVINRIRLIDAIYCKSNLYVRINCVWPGKVASGANLDDLGDYRPGLLAAKEKNVVHPFIDAGINKSMARAIAHRLALNDFANFLPNRVYPVVWRQVLL